MARYESFAALQRIIETGNGQIFVGRDPKPLAKFLRRSFSGGDEFIDSDPVLARLNRKRIEYFPLACCLACGGDAALMDEFCAI